MSNQLQQQKDNESFVTHLLNFIIGIYPLGNNSFIQATATATLTLVVILMRIGLVSAKPSGLVFAIHMEFGILFHQIL